MLQIPFTSIPSEQFTSQLGDGNKYVFITRWNEQSGEPGDASGFWTFDMIRDSDQVTLQTGIPILLGEDLLDPYGLGSGRIIAIDTGPDDLDAGPDDLGDRVLVFWVGADEDLAALAEGG